MRTIHKYKLELSERQVVMMPEGALIRHVALQLIDGKLLPCIWAEVHTNKPMRTREIALVGTGRMMSQGTLLYLGSVHYEREGLVWHIYECYRSRPALQAGDNHES